MRARIGIDAGGTFTDLVLVNRESGALCFHKESSTPRDPAAAIDTDLGQLIALDDCTPDDIELIANGTTLSHNAILQHRGTRVELVVSLFDKLANRNKRLEPGGVRQPEPDQGWRYDAYLLRDERAA